MRGSHRIYKHPIKKGIVVVAGHTGEDMDEGTWRNIQRQAGWRV
ncbi:MAG: type II toxin-antitoxin system HicA family toxin [Chloroflexi bacterium]|nr:type II toxin-antitoxin system HicA family toxin [Chloroflexota bacterium]